MPICVRLMLWCQMPICVRLMSYILNQNFLMTISYNPYDEKYI